MALLLGDAARARALADALLAVPEGQRRKMALDTRVKLLDYAKYEGADHAARAYQALKMLDSETLAMLGAVR